MAKTVEPTNQFRQSVKVAMAESVEPINNFENDYRRSIAIRPDRRGARKAKPQVGRYDGRTHNTRVPPAGLGQVPKTSSRTVDMVVAAVEDPMGNGQERLFASVNSRVDILEMERSHKRISENAYRTGRLVQAVFERLGGNISGSNWCGASRIDAMQSQSMKMERLLMSIEAARKLQDEISGHIGIIGMRLLRRLLSERLSFADCAALQGKNGARGTTYINLRFREALEDLAEARIGKGKVIATPNDKHAAAAPGVAARQSVSIEKGVTAARLAAEAEEEKLGYSPA